MKFKSPSASSLQPSASLYFVTGSDEAEVRRRAQEKALELAPDPTDAFGLEIIEPSNDTVDQAVEALEKTLEAILTFPFLGGKKLVWLKNVNCLKDTPAGRSESVQATLEKLLVALREGLPKGVVLLISAPEPDKRRAFYKNFSSLAQLTLCDKPDFGFNATEQDIVQWVIQRAHDRGVDLDTEPAEVLATRIGANSGQLEIELLKLVTAAGAVKLITKTSVQELVPLTRTGGIFDLSNAISERNLPLSLKTLQQLLYQGESAMGLLLAAIVPTVRNLLLVKDLMERHKIKPPAKAAFFSGTLQKLPLQETSHLPRKKDGALNAYGLGLAAMHAYAFQREELIQGFLACRDCQSRLLRGQRAEAVLLTQLIVKLVAKKNPSKNLILDQ
ncbi:MAG: DNA polymerase III subunit delta [Chthoniobacterales bacterium]